MIRKIKRKQNIRGNPKCRGCGANIKELHRKGMNVYSTHTGKIRYYCFNCKNDQFGGVRLRAEYESG